MTAQANHVSKTDREKLLKEMEIRVGVFNEGIHADVSLFQQLDFENEYLEQVQACFYNNHQAYKDTNLPQAFRSPSGYRYAFSYDPQSRYSITGENGRFYLHDRQTRLFEVKFEKRPKYYNQHTSNGKKMSTIAQYVGSSKITVAYSNECSLQEKNLDCRFCNINATKANYADRQGISWKTPAEIAEVTKAAYAEGCNHLTITGGFIPERREVEYYIDVAEAIRETTGLDDFGGTACIGAPLDLEVIDKYKEAGYSRIATNMEIWDENIFKAICPGKHKICGGYQNWVDTLKYEVEVFGKGNVRSYFVAGIETKETLLEGIEYLASLGVVAVPQIWMPKPGAALEGHRAPTTEWFIDLFLKAYKILVRYGITHEQFYHTTNDEGRFFDYLYDADGDYLNRIADYRIAI
ncbi:radical SAM protein [Propionispora vibrioides]|uniref:Radical SAM superfamily protein n=1 Tax=Propionispora vibrioides TaxID=112903 RepID=A0A1H8XTH4_9FIRM|nr:radical SAM protein [Propionispora vibrioides]SEP43053.1 Radical SAM superfamily protein [Propionispora vibrioides]